MLQPRLRVEGSVSVLCAANMGVSRVIDKRVRCLAWFICAALFFNYTLVLCQDINNASEDTIEATRIKRDSVPENRDLTVLLVNDNKRLGDYNKIGRYQSIKPVIGLLTSTARTFIQDGVTTEFATQILGTTLNNGRIYAQILTKSSLVLYNNPSKVDDAVDVRPTRVHSAFDDQWSVKQDLGFIDPENFVLKNTDYLAPSDKMEIVYPSKPSESYNNWNAPTPEGTFENQILDEPTGRRVQPFKEIPRYVQNEALNYLDGPSIESDRKFEFVIKPSIINNVNTLHRSSKAYEPKQEIKLDARIKEEIKNINESSVVKVKPNYDLPTFTIKNEFSPIFYYIDNVESRSSVNQQSQQTKLPKKLFGQNNEPRPKKTFTYAGFADFTTVVGDTVIIFTPNTETNKLNNPGQVDVFPSAKRVEKLASKITFLSADIPLATSTFKPHEVKATKIATPHGEDSRSEKALYNDEESLKKVLYDVDDKLPDAINVQYNNGFNLNMDVIQPSEPATTTERTKVVNNLEVIPIHSYNSQATDPLKNLRPSATVTEDESAVTEGENDYYTDSDETISGNSDEVTDTNQEEVTTENETETESTTEDNTETTSNDSDGQEKDSHAVICTNGIETQSTMTTEYKTLTYLTTYFIPLENTDTTTSIKSNVVVESKVGYLTNVVCKSDIQPTATIKEEIKPTLQSSLEQPEIKPVTEKEVESSPEMTTSDELLTTLSDTTPNIKNEDEIIVKENKETTTSTTTTENSVTTSQSHVEVSVTTEESPNISTEENSNESKEQVDSNENEIDLIYKTLYTTYTYFTTFFGDQTSSIASHKSVVTNIVTSTINLSKMDPSLLGVFDEDEIAPTSVGIGRPTESFVINSIIDLVKNKDVIESVENGEAYSSQTPTPSLGDDVVASIKPDAVKTYYTTYTFFTTIFVGNDANICSRNEVYTNYVGPEELIPTKSNLLGAENTKAQFDFRNCRQVKNMQEPTTEPQNPIIYDNKLEDSDFSSPQPTPVEVDMLFSVESNPVESENSFVTDVKSSSSKGDKQIVENNNVLEDQISSESNIEEIIPSPTLLLQTSYTTFTYFTTMYIGKDSSKIKSRLETITNVVTETIRPKKELDVEESNLPVTYYTTFTYWTTLCKDDSTTITSREEIVSNVVSPAVQSIPTISPIDTTPIDIDSVIPPKDIGVEIKPSLIEDSLEQDDGKATFYTTYTYFTTFYAGNTSQIRSRLVTETNIVENSKIDDNQLGRKVQSGANGNNLVQDNDGKVEIKPSVVKEEIKPTQSPDISAGPSSVLLGTYIDNLYAEVKPADITTPKPVEQKILFSQVAVISGDSTIVTNDNKTLSTEKTTTSTSTTTTPKDTLISPTPDVIESSVTEPETTTELKPDEEEEDSGNKKKSRLTFTTKKPSFTPVIRPFASRNRPTFSPKRVPSISSATVITRSDFTPTITATPTLKSIRPSSFGSRKQSAFPGLSSAGGRRFSGRSSIASPPSNNPAPSRSVGFNRGSIQPSSRRQGFRSSSSRSSIDFANRSNVPRIRPTASIKLRGGRQSSVVQQPEIEDSQVNESETSITQDEEHVTEPLEEATEAPARTTSNPLLRFRRPPINRTPGTAVTRRTTTQITTRRTPATLGRITTTTRRTTTRTTNPLLSLRRQRPNALFPRRNLFKQPEPEPEEEIKNDEQEVNQGENDEILEEEDLDQDNDYDSSDRKEQHIATPTTPAPKRNSNVVQIRPFAFRRRTKRQTDYGNRKYTNFRRPGTKPSVRRSEPEPETEAPVTQKARSSRYNSRGSVSARITTGAPVTRATSRQPFILRGGESRTTTSASTFRNRKIRPSGRSTTISSRPKAPRLTGYNSQTERSRSSPQRTTSRSRSRGGSSTRSSVRQRNYNDNSGERLGYYQLPNDGRFTITHHIPTEVTIPVVNGKITEYKNVLTAKPSIETVLANQVSTSLGPLGNHVLILASESTKLAENGVTKIIKFILHESPTTTIIFTPTTIRGRKTSYSHIVPSTVYDVEYVTSTLTPELNANVPLANLLLSQLLLGNPQQQAINPLLALQGQGLIQPQPIVQTPVTEYKTRTTTYVTTVTDARETVLPITFKGKAILTTIVNPSVNVITATEFITETIVVTPTVLAPQNNQFNSLLLPLLLQQQQQQQLSLQTQNPLLGLQQPDLLVQNNNLLNNDILINGPKPNILDITSNEELNDSIQEEEDIPPPSKPARTKNKPRPPKPSPPKLTSVVTLYVSGRIPGEFSTVLSTVVTDDTQVVRKREAIYYDSIKLLPSILPSLEELSGSRTDSVLENVVLAETEKFLDDKTVENQMETQSLESIVGELSRHIRYDASPTYVVKLLNPSTISDSTQSSIDDVS